MEHVHRVFKMDKSVKNVSYVGASQGKFLKIFKHNGPLRAVKNKVFALRATAA